MAGIAMKSSNIAIVTSVWRMAMVCLQVKQPRPIPRKLTTRIVFYAKILISVPIQRISSISRNSASTLTRKIARVRFDDPRRSAPSTPLGALVVASLTIDALCPIRLDE